MATVYDPMTLEALMQSMPDLQRKKRRAESLRKTQEKFEKQAAAAAARGPQNYAPQQMGGLFPTVQQYQPDMGNAAQQGIGALGQYLTGQSADGAQGEYDQAQAQAVLQGAQQMGGGGQGAGLEAAAGQPQGTPANEAAMRAYMAMIGGPDLANAIGAGNKARANQIDEDGYIWTQMSNGEWKNSGIKARSGVRTIVDPVSGELIQVSTTTQGGVNRVTEGGENEQGGPTAAGTPVRLGTAAEAAGNKKTAELTAEAAGAPLIQAREEAEKTGTLTGEARTAARQGLPKAKQSLALVKSHVEKLVKNPVIEQITGSTLPGRASAIPVIGGALNDILLGSLQTKGKAGADANAIINQLTDEAFLDAYSDSMRGTGPISNVEGLRAAQSKLRAARYQSPAQFKDALDEFVVAFESTVNRMEESLNAPTPTLSAPNPAAAAAAGEPQTLPTGRTAVPATFPGAADMIRNAQPKRKRTFEELQQQYGKK